ncbi:macrophage mannose receptor 1-like [Astyanax mexicanus]|uniref:macrophage mannose receptor 1-like n=1 Tax=Astyanax mexicanus TaxID=7994 RepID=UPI0020CAE132|nr:macrophage mannose receptor 1-like [Astyanax mexicanus]
MKTNASWESLQCDQTDLTFSYHLITENKTWYEAQTSVNVSDDRRSGMSGTLNYCKKVFSPAEQNNRLTTFHLIEKNLTQSEARAACRENYTDLVTVYNDEDITALIRLTGIGSAWTGLYRNQPSVKWSNGDDVTFRHQKTGDCGSWPCCAAMKADGLWENLQCTQTRNFMCYKQDQTNSSYHLITEKMTWYEAQSYCRKNYTDLVSIRDQEQNEAVKIAGMNSSDPFWIGLLRDDWQWADGGRSAYRNWWDDHPKPSPADCVKLVSGKMYSVPCSNTGSALCYSTFLHVSEDHMNWENAFYYCKKDNRAGLLHIHTESDHTKVKNELRKMGISGTFWDVQTIRLGLTLLTAAAVAARNEPNNALTQQSSER